MKNTFKFLSSIVTISIRESISTDGKTQKDKIIKRKFVSQVLFVMIIVTGFITIGCQSMGLANLSSRVNRVVTTYHGSVPIEQCARVYIGSYLQVVGVDGGMSPLKYIAIGRDVLLLEPRLHIIHVNAFDGRVSIPPYPGLELEYELEAGKIYYVYVDNIRASQLRFRIRELEVLPDDYMSIYDKTVIADKEAFIQDIENAIAKLR